jgi:hypothetical protein
MAIKKGDRLILNDRGRERIVQALSDEADGSVQIKDDKGVISAMSIYNLRPVDNASQGESPGTDQLTGV